jgi:hypothetical protein
MKFASNLRASIPTRWIGESFGPGGSSKRDGEGSLFLHAGAGFFFAIGGLARTETGIITEHDGAARGLPAPLALPDLIVAGGGSDGGGEQQSQCCRQRFNETAITRLPLHVRNEWALTGSAAPPLPCCTFWRAPGASQHPHPAVPRTSSRPPLASRRPVSRRAQSRRFGTYVPCLAGRT